MTSDTDSVYISVNNKKFLPQILCGSFLSLLSVLKVKKVSRTPVRFHFRKKQNKKTFSSVGELCSCSNEVCPLGGAVVKRPNIFKPVEQVSDNHNHCRTEHFIHSFSTACRCVQLTYIFQWSSLYCKSQAKVKVQRNPCSQPFLLAGLGVVLEGTSAVTRFPVLFMTASLGFMYRRERGRGRNQSNYTAALSESSNHPHPHLHQ